MAETLVDQENNLQTLPDLVLVKHVKDQDDLLDKSFEILAERHSGLYAQTVLRTSGSSIPNLKDDLIDEKLFVLYEAIRTYDENRGTAFNTHFANCARWNCLTNKSRKSNIEITVEPAALDTLVDQDAGASEEQCYDPSDIEEIKAKIESLEDERAKKILRLRYFSSGTKIIPWKKIANEVQLSIQGAINVHDKYVAIIRKNIRKKHQNEYK